MNLDALIPREDFAVQGSGDEAPVQQTIQVRDLEKVSFFFGAIRKPDFQRENSEWTPQRVVGLIKTFIEGELTPRSHPVEEPRLALRDRWIPSAQRL